MSPTLLLVISYFGGLAAVQWIPDTQIQTTRHVCLGGNAILGWHMSVERGEVIRYIKWLFTPHGSLASYITAEYTHKTFTNFVPFGARLTHQGGGFVMRLGVTPADVGLYTVEVNAMGTTGLSHTIRRNLTLAVQDPATYRSRRLTLQMDKQALHDTLQHMQLMCGPLAWPGEPPVDVIWKTPSGAEQTSSYFHNGTFRLALDGSPQYGLYTCRLAPSAQDALCLKYGDPILEEASVYFGADVDQRTLLDEVELVQPPNRYSRDQPQQLEQCCILAISREVSRNYDLSKRVHFHVKASKTVTVKYVDDAIFDQVILNTGGAYDIIKDYFVAPVTGHYFFAATVTPADWGSQTVCVLIASGLIKAWAKTQFTTFANPAVIHTVVYIMKGDIVQLQTRGHINRFSPDSVFTGFLIRSEL